MNNDLVSRNKIWEALTLNVMSSYLIMVFSALVLIVLGISYYTPLLLIARWSLLVSIIIVVWVQFLNGKDLECGLQLKYSDKAERKMFLIGRWNKILFAVGMIIYTIGIITSGFGFVLPNS